MRLRLRTPARVRELDLPRLHERAHRVPVPRVRLVEPAGEEGLGALQMRILLRFCENFLEAGSSDRIFIHTTKGKLCKPHAQNARLLGDAESAGRVPLQRRHHRLEGALDLRTPRSAYASASTRLHSSPLPGSIARESLIQFGGGDACILDVVLQPLQVLIYSLQPPDVVVAVLHKVHGEARGRGEHSEGAHPGSRSLESREVCRMPVLDFKDRALRRSAAVPQNYIQSTICSCVKFSASSVLSVDGR